MRQDLRSASKLITSIIVLSLAIPVPPHVQAGPSDWAARLAAEIIKGIVVGVAVDVATKALTDKGSAQANPTRPSVDAFEDFARRHFQTDASCDVQATMRFYGPRLYYEDLAVDADYVLRTKQAACRRYTKDSFLTIRSGSMRVTVAPNNYNIKIVDYIVDFDVFSIQQNTRLQGATSVRLVLDATSGGPLIVGESHKRL